MKIIVLVGKPNTGKTTTLKKLIKELAGKDGENLQDIEFAHICKTFISPQKRQLLESLENNDADAFVKVEYNSFKIGIATAGDCEWNISHKLGLLQDCDIYICASRDCGESYEYIEELDGLCDNEGQKIHQIYKVTKIGCIGDKDDVTYRLLSKHSEELAIVEILKHLEGK